MKMILSHSKYTKCNINKCIFIGIDATNPSTDATIDLLVHIGKYVQTHIAQR